MSSSKGDGPSVRVNRKRGYTVIFNDLFQVGMDMREWGLFCYLLMKPDGWDARVWALQQEFGNGRDAIRGTLNALVERGLMIKEEYCDGNLRRYRYILNADEPGTAQAQTPSSAPETGSQAPGSPSPEAPDADPPATEGHPQVKKDLGTTDLPTTDLRTERPPLRDDPLGDTTNVLQMHPDEALLPGPVRPPTLDQRAEHLLRPWWTDLQATRPERVPGQSYVTVKGVVRAALGNGKPERLVVAGLNQLVLQGRPVSGGTLQMAMTEAASLPTAPEEFRPFAAVHATGVASAAPSKVDAELADLMERRRQRHAAREDQGRAQGGRA